MSWLLTFFSVGLIVTSDMLNPKSIANQSYKFQTLFSEQDICASGVLAIPKDGEKPDKNSKHKTLVRHFSREKLQDHTKRANRYIT